jgi:hypothetical protein
LAERKEYDKIVDKTRNRKERNEGKKRKYII